MVNVLNRYREQSPQNTRNLYLTVQNFPFTDAERRRLAMEGVLSFSEDSDEIAGSISPVARGLLEGDRVLPTYFKAKNFLFSYKHVTRPPQMEDETKRDDVQVDSTNTLDGERLRAHQARMARAVMGSGPSEHLYKFLEPGDAAAMRAVARLTREKAKPYAQCQSSDCPSNGRLFISSGCKKFCINHLWSWITDMIEYLLFSQRSQEYMESNASKYKPIQLKLEIYSDVLNSQTYTYGEPQFGLRTSASGQAEEGPWKTSVPWKISYVFNFLEEDNDDQDRSLNGAGKRNWDTAFRRVVNNYKNKLKRMRRRHPIEKEDLTFYLTVIDFPFTPDEEKIMKNHGIRFFPYYMTSDVHFSDYPVQAGLLDVQENPRKANEIMVFTFQTVPDPQDDDVKITPRQNSEEKEEKTDDLWEKRKQNRYNMYTPRFGRWYPSHIPRPTKYVPPKGNENLFRDTGGYAYADTYKNRPRQTPRESYRDEDGQPDPKRQRRGQPPASASSASSASSSNRPYRDEDGQPNPKRQRSQ